TRGGDEAVQQTPETTGGDGRASLTESVAYRRLLPLEALRQLKPRRGLLVYGHLPPVRIRLRPWFRSRRLVSLAMAVDAAVPHPAMAVDNLAPGPRPWGPPPPACPPRTWPPAGPAGRPPVTARQPRRARRPRSTNGGLSTPSRSWPARAPAAGRAGRGGGG